MISIISCSRNFDLSPELKYNINETIGIEYELIIIDNSNNTYSIFEAYNIGVQKAKFPYLCFMHDDILYHTKDWGINVIKHFNNNKIGVIGIAGGHYLANTPSSWFNTPFRTINIIQTETENNKIINNHIIENKYTHDNSVEVVAVDGVWFCMPKRIFTHVSFDNINFDGYHCYDLDICLQVRKNNKEVRVVMDVLIEHFSYGSSNQKWIDNSIILSDKWKMELPQIASIELNQNEKDLVDVFVNEKFQLLMEINKLQSQILSILNSKAYKIGKLLLKPLKTIFK